MSKVDDSASINNSGNVVRYTLIGRVAVIVVEVVMVVVEVAVMTEVVTVVAKTKL